MVKYFCRISFVFAILSVATGCGQNTPDSAPSVLATSEDLVIRARAVFDVSTDSGSTLHQRFIVNGTGSLEGNQPITVVNGAQTTMTLDNSHFVIPTISTALLSFGYLQITKLIDNDLNQCGPNHNTRCNTALIRIYTIGTAGSGLYNSTDGYGLPITAGQSTFQPVGLNIAGAALMQSITIGANRHTVKLSDFTNPKYNVKIDFSDAGVGTFSTTLVVEYALAP